SRQRAINNLMKRHHNQLDFHEYEPGMYVWLRESQLETQKGNKTDWTYSGPYVIHAKRESGSFVLRELNGAIMHRHVHVQRLRLFFFHPDNQTLNSSIPSRPKIRRTKVHLMQQVNTEMSEGPSEMSLTYSDIHSGHFSTVSTRIQDIVKNEAMEALKNGVSSSNSSYFVCSFPLRSSWSEFHSNYPSLC
ncbi:hypothetical protein BT96DRAFT_833488, partial [Gymnopus androsaceus JB14]